MYNYFSRDNPEDELIPGVCLTYLSVGHLEVEGDQASADGFFGFIDGWEGIDASHSWEATGSKDRSGSITWSVIRSGKYKPEVGGVQLSKYYHGRENFTVSSAIDAAIRESIRKHLALALKMQGGNNAGK